MGRAAAGRRRVHQLLLQSLLHSMRPPPALSSGCAPSRPALAHLQLLEADAVPNSDGAARQGGVGRHPCRRLLAHKLVRHLAASAMQGRVGAMGYWPADIDAWPAQGELAWATLSQLLHPPWHQWLATGLLPTPPHMPEVACPAAGAASGDRPPSPHSAHLRQLGLGQAAHQLHSVIAVGQVQAQHIRQQRAPPLPRRAAQVLQSEGWQGGAGRGGASVGAAQAWLGGARLEPQRAVCGTACGSTLPTRTNHAFPCCAALPAHLALLIQPALLEHALGCPRDALAAARKA